MNTTIEFDLHGLAGIRLLDATEEDAAMVTRQVGPIQAALNREPDITIHFVDHLDDASPVNYLGVRDAGFTRDAFLILHSLHKLPARVQIPLDQVGKGIEITCERGLNAVPLLIPILNLTVLQNGALPIHASSFNYQGCGILVTGWAKGGKTETLLAFMAQGADYIGDEWIYLDQNQELMYGIPEPIRLWAWHLAEVPQYRAAIRRSDRVKLKALSAAGRLLAVDGKNPGSQSHLQKLIRRSSILLRKQEYVQVPPSQLFGAAACPMKGRLDKVFFVGSWGDPRIVVEPVDPEEVASRMVFSLQEESRDFISAYLKFRFAFPERRNLLIEQSETLQREALLRALAGKEAYQVYHPYPVHIPDLYGAIRPYIH